MEPPSKKIKIDDRGFKTHSSSVFYRNKFHYVMGELKILFRRLKEYRRTRWTSPSLRYFVNVGGADFKFSFERFTLLPSFYEIEKLQSIGQGSVLTNCRSVPSSVFGFHVQVTGNYSLDHSRFEKFFAKYYDRLKSRIYNRSKSAYSPDLIIDPTKFSCMDNYNRTDMYTITFFAFREEKDIRHDLIGLIKYDLDDLPSGSGELDRSSLDRVLRFMIIYERFYPFEERLNLLKKISKLPNEICLIIMYTVYLEENEHLKFFIKK